MGLVVVLFITYIYALILTLLCILLTDELGYYTFGPHSHSLGLSIIA